MTEYGCNAGKNYKEADGICKKIQGLNLCSEDQIIADVTAGTGCGYDNTVVWTSTCAEVRTILKGTSAAV